MSGHKPLKSAINFSAKTCLETKERVKLLLGIPKERGLWIESTKNHAVGPLGFSLQHGR